MFVKSRERAAAMKRDNYSCQKCGVKQSKAKGREQKIDVHHLKGIYVWDSIIQQIQDHILCDAKDLQCLCPACHQQITNN